MKNRIITNTGNSTKVKMGIDSSMTWEQFRAAAIAGNLPADIVATTNGTGTSQVGTPLTADTLLKDATATALGVTSSDPTVNEAFESLEVTQEVIDALAAIGITVSGGVVQAVKALAEYLTPVTIRPTIDRSSGGTLQTVTAIKAGNRVDLQLTIANSTNVANAGNVFVGTIDEQYRPKVFVCGGGYYNGIHADIAITPAGAVTIRNTGTTSTFNGLNVGISYTV